MLWEITTPESGNDFSNIAPSEVLYEFDGPKIFTSLDGSHMCLWYECGEDIATNVIRYLVAPVNSRIVEQLKNGTKTVFEALSQPWIWAVDVRDGNAEKSWILGSLDEVPPDAKPDKETPLWPELVPLLSYRLIGPGLQEGAIPASVVARAVSGATSAIKALLESVNDTQSPVIGRPDEGFRRLYDVVAKRFAYNSFEVTFDAPIIKENQAIAQVGREQNCDLLSVAVEGQGTDLTAVPTVQTNFPSIPSSTIVEATRRSELYQQSAIKLAEALTWLESDSQAVTELSSGILSALEHLVPPKHGQILEAELRGRLIPDGRSILLTRDSTAKVKKAISTRKERARQLVTTEGRVGQFDKDKLIFTLRDRPNGEPDLLCSFSEEHYDDLFDAFVADERHVLLQGRWHADRRGLEVIAVEVVQELQDNDENIKP